MALLPQKIYSGFKTEAEFAQGSHRVDDGWSVSISLRGPETIDQAATVSGTNYKLAFTPTQAGVFLYSIVAESISERVLIETGRIEALPDPTTVEEGTDNRNYAERMLDAIEAVLEKRASSDQQSYSIAGRSITRIPLTELLALRDKFRAEVAIGKKNAPRYINVRFAR